MSAEQLKSLAEDAKAWPFAEARALQDRLSKLTDDMPERPVLFETGMVHLDYPILALLAK